MERALVWGSRGAWSQILVGSAQNLCMCRQECIYAQHTLGHTQAEIDTDAHRPMPTFTLDTCMQIHPACTRSCHKQACVCLSKVGGRGSWRSLVCRERRARWAGGVRIGSVCPCSPTLLGMERMKRGELSPSPSQESGMDSAPSPDDPLP